MNMKESLHDNAVENKKDKSMMLESNTSNFSNKLTTSRVQTHKHSRRSAGGQQEVSRRSAGGQQEVSRARSGVR